MHPTDIGHKLIATSLLPLLLRKAGLQDILQVAEKSIRQDPAAERKSPRAMADEIYLSGTAYLFNERPEEAEKINLKVLKLDPLHPSALADLGHIYLMQGRLVEAESFLRRALAIDPESTYANYYLGLLQFEKGDPENAGKILRGILRRNPEQPDALMLMGDIALRKGAFRDALEFYRKTQALGFEDSHLHLMTGKVFLSLGDNAAARTELAKALELDPTDEEASRLMNSIR